MKHFISIFILTFLFTNYLFAQLVVKDQALVPNNLLIINDEGDAGSISLFNVSSIMSDPKLYSFKGSLFWGSNQLGLAGSAGGWTDIGSYVRLTNSGDNVGIGTGTSSPLAKFHVIGDDGVLYQGTLGSGAILNLGTGVRMMWYPRKAALRAGDPVGTNWDDANIGNYSTAFGQGTKAGGQASFSAGFQNEAMGNFSSSLGDENYSTGIGSFTSGHWNTASGTYASAIGQENIASGYASSAIGYEAEATAGRAIAIGSDARCYGTFAVAIGEETRAGGNSSTALGSYAQATGPYSRSIGSHTTADGDYSTAMGSYVNITGNGSFIIGDHSVSAQLTKTGTNRFYARFAGGYYLYTNSLANIGMFMSAGGNSWSVISDSTKKENFKSVDGESVLDKISRFRLGTWNYKGQDPNKFRHYGPMAQDFFAAFGNDGIGEIGCDTLLASADVDGVNLIAIKALEKRTKDLQNDLHKLSVENDELKERIQKLEEYLEIKFSMK